MKKHIFLSCFLLMTICLLAGAQINKDSMAINNCVLDYIEGWYDGDVERMDNALHRDLAKRSLSTIQQTGGSYIQSLTKSMMLEYTRAGGGTMTPKDDLYNQVEILGVYHGIASVKVISFDFIDYCHLVKHEDKWQIINVLWERNTQK